MTDILPLKPEYAEVAEIDQILTDCYDEVARLNILIAALQTRRINILTGAVEL